MRPLVAALLAGSLAALAFAAVAARADGDPASDVLYFQDVFLPYQVAAAGEAAADLAGAVAEANKAGYKIKVAVIASPQDLGVMATIFGRPQLYARFLGAELRSFFTGHLLIVMGRGFGVWFNRFDVRPQLRLLREVKIESRDPVGLVRSAAKAVRALREKDKSIPRIYDVNPPEVLPVPVYGKRGPKVRLEFSVWDDSGRSRAEVRVYGARLALLAVLNDPMTKAIGPADLHSVVWHRPKTLRVRPLKFCVVGIDPSGNQSKANCAPFFARS
jgi:hypothetical protein